MSIGAGQTRFRWIFAAALVAGASYFAVTRTGVDGAALIAWKGAGVGLLALWAALNARSRDGWLIAAVLALGALGDVLLAAAGLTVGALAFLAGHVVAAMLYFRNRARSWWMMLPAVVLVPLVAVVIAPTPDAGIALYATGLGAMAGAALIGRFPRIVGIGAMLFVLSDWLIFAETGALAGSPLPGLLIWPLYFAGQAMITGGLIGFLAGEGAHTSQ
ncbi:lysoplasmalogenase family protein [Sphingomonas cannabina]|uniref:lysoplasmalogenase family protein n=1 Tax=Sphingomonas cannabina TaxID=2899123 RepID=UPI001F382FA1|nr:lysoplasmalogenase family protein [Sphingomonas cannabina]UIJ43680.1 lysoplasmalogenase family protein [Sphingomonas cannabina]